jgi:hypothetical protein
MKTVKGTLFFFNTTTPNLTMGMMNKEGLGE